MSALEEGVTPKELKVDFSPDPLSARLNQLEKRMAQLESTARMILDKQRAIVAVLAGDGK